MKSYDYIVYVGRYQPFHNGHAETVRIARQLAKKKVIIIVGTANSAPTPKNPWTADERIEMITKSMGDDKLHFVPAEDRLYNGNKWFTFVQSRVDEIANGDSVAIIGHDKDDSSFYLKDHFTDWDFVETGPYIKEFGGNGKVVSSTKIRELVFENHVGYTESNLPRAVYNQLIEYTQTDTFTDMQAEYDEYLRQQAFVKQLPHGMIFYTVDALVEQSSKILLIKRSQRPGKGLWALPGVHIGMNEQPLEAALRAIYKETNMKVSERPLIGSMKDTQDFDHPDRSLRARLTEKNARTITKAFYFSLDPSHPIPKVRAGDGVEKAWWFNFAEIKKMRSQLFEDHADIIDYFIR